MWDFITLNFNNMKNLYIVVGAIVAVSVCVVFISILFRKNDSDLFPYQKRKYFLSPTEKIFFDLLLRLLKDEYFIFPQVHIASVLEVKRGQANYMSYFNKIIRKSFDFVILDKQTMNALVAIELDDVSHERPNRILRDTFVNNAVGAANFPILHFKAEKEYNEENLLLELNKVLKPEQLAAQRP